MLNLDILKLNKRKLLIGIFILVICGYLNMISIQSQQGLYVNLVNVPKMTCFEYFLNIQGDAVGFLHIVYFLAITLVIGDIFIKEKKSSMLYFSLVRSDVNRYIKQKIIGYVFVSSYVINYINDSISNCIPVFISRICIIHRKRIFFKPSISILLYCDI